MRPGFWRKCRRGFRWLRITTLLVMLAAVICGVWLNRVGVPNFAKTRLVAALREHGVELAFSRMRVRVVRGLVAENVRLGDAKTPGNPSLAAEEVQLKLNLRAFLHGELQVDGVILQQGKLTLPLLVTNGPSHELVLDNIQTTVRFQTNETWSLDHFQADFGGAKLNLSGDIAHAPELRGWELFRSRPGKTPGAWRAQLQQLSDTIDQIHFTGTPQLGLTLNGDAHDLHSLLVKLTVNGDAAQTPWGSARNIQLTAKLTAPADAPTNFDESLAGWTNAFPYRLDWNLHLAQLRTEKVNADSVLCAGVWRAPELAITRLSARLGGGQLEAGARLNVATRELTFTNASSFDIHAIAAWLTEKTRARLAEISWTRPPMLRAGGALVLPAWTKRDPDWRGEVQQTVRLSGELAFTNCTLLGAALDTVQTHFSYSNLVWELPDLAVAQSKTRLLMSGGEDDATKDYHWRIRGVFDPDSARPFLTTSNAVRGFEIVQFTEPLALDAEVRGRLYDYDRIAVNGDIALTNFTVRGEVFGDVTAAVNYTNRVLELLHPLLHNGAQMLKADRLALDFDRRMIYFTNGFSFADPQPMARAIGPKTGRTVEPYHFVQPPTARINGQLPMGDIKIGEGMTNVDLQFDIIKGAPFEWLKLKTPDITGTVHWKGEWLYLSNVVTELYGGMGAGNASFDFRVPHAGADYHFDLNVTNVDLHLLAADMATTTNHLEGVVSGQLIVTDASTQDLMTWNGFGNAHLRDGLLWDVPVFGVLSPVLNAVTPGLGSSRATEATARYIIANGVIETDSLEIHSTLARLQYVGTVDLKQNVSARVTAQPLRNLWVIGPVIGTLLTPVGKLFEYKVSGTLKNPKTEPIYVPKFLLMPLHPIRSLEGLFPSETKNTNAPPGN
jgi:hypothetical protein